MADDESTTDEQDTTDEQTDEQGSGAAEGKADDEGQAKDESDSEDGGSDEGSEGSEGVDKSEERSETNDPAFGKKEDEPANEVQMSYMRPLAEATGDELPNMEDMSEAEAADKINELQDNAAGS